VFELSTAGLPHKGSAPQLHRSVRTVDHHVAAILAKLNVPTCAEAACMAPRPALVKVDRGAQTPLSQSAKERSKRPWSGE
jgi:hypothetical protein